MIKKEDIKVEMPKEEWKTIFVFLLFRVIAGCALVVYGSIVMPVRVFVNSYGQYNALKI